MLSLLHKPVFCLTTGVVYPQRDSDPAAQLSYGGETQLTPKRKENIILFIQCH